MRVELVTPCSHGQEFVMVEVPVPALAESGIPSGRVVAVGFVFDARTGLKNEASRHAYSTTTNTGS